VRPFQQEPDAVAGPARARTQDVKPAAEKTRSADQRAVPAKQAGPITSSRLPSPQVAAAILAGATHTPRAPEPTTSTKKPAGAPPPLVSEKSPAQVKIDPRATVASKLAGGAATPTPTVARAGAPPLTLVPKPAAAAAAAPAAAAKKPPTAKAAMAAPSGAAPAEAPDAATPAAAEPDAAQPDAGKTEAKGKGESAKDAKPAADGAAPDGGEGPAGGGGAGAVALKLQMPEAPTEPSAATKKRIHGVQGRAGHAAAAKSALPAGDKQVGDAQKAVDQPPAEARAKAQEDLVKLLGAQQPPSQAIVELAQRIRKVIREKRPPDEDALVEAKPEAEAVNAGGQLNSTVEGETKKVQDNYGPLDKPAAGAPPAKGQDLPPQPDAAATPGVNAKAATPDAVPDQNVSLDKDAEASKKKMTDAGMDTPPAQLVQSGPVAEARGAQGELEQAAKEDPAKVLAGQKEALGKAEDDMAALQQQAIAALTTSRAASSKHASAQQKDMVGSEESRRAQVSAEAQQTFSEAQTAVDGLLKNLASNAINEWEAAKTLLVSQFKSDLAIVQKRVEDRHSGVGGFFTGLWDAATGLPGWAEDAYNKAEYNFSEGVIAKITEISVKVNTVIAACELLIKQARDKIAKLFADAKATLGDWAVQEQAKFDGQLDKLRDQALSTRDNFNKDLIERSSQAVDEVRAEISELRKKAGGLIGRIANAIGRFLDDPVKFIIEGLLEILGIPPAAFWAVVAKIKKVIKDIADDPMKFANNLMAGLAQGFSQFFDNILTHLLKGFLSWLTRGLGDVGVQLPKDLSLKSIITFFLQLMGITWPRIRKVLAKHVGEKNVALLEKVYSLVSFLIEKGPEGIFEMIKEKLDPQSIVDQVIQLAVDFLISAVIKAATARILLLFNPAGAIFQALEAIYRVLKWIFQNAARIFTLIETVVNGIADILAGSIGGFANAVEKALAMLIAPVISFIADYLGFGDLPEKIAAKIKSFQDMVLEIIEKVLVFLIEKGKALLATLGIGGKDKDKKDGAGAGAIGEDIGWSVGNESHRLWIASEGAGYVPMMASGKPHPVRPAITAYQAQADTLAKTDEERAQHARTGIRKADKALSALEKALEKQEKLAADPNAKAGKATKADNDVVAKEEALKDAIAEVQELLDLNDDDRVKKARKEFGGSPFSAKKGLAPALEVAERTAQSIAQAWVQRGIVFRVQSATTDPGGMLTFDPATAEWRETNPNNRQKYGYVNPKKTSAAGLEILSKGLLGQRVAGKYVKPTSAEKRDPRYHEDLAEYESKDPASSASGFAFEVAILGHKPPGASGHWNDEGHQQTRSENYAWNQDPKNYHGPEREDESSASGAAAERYMLPSKEEGSHKSWWS
jgi:hypothetical protein